MNIRHRVELDAAERPALHEILTAGGKVAVRRIRRAQVLLAVDRSSASPVLSDEQVAAALSVGTSTVYRVKRRFVELGLDAALSEEPRPGGVRKTSALQDATLIALA